MKVKLRKEGTLLSREYTELRTRIDDLRLRARTGESAAPAAPPPSSSTRQLPAPEAPSASQPAVPQPRGTSGSQLGNEVPAGTELDVRLQNTLNSGTAQVEDRFEGTSIVDLTVEGRTLVPAGSVLRGTVTAVEPASRTNRTARLTLGFDEMVVDGQTYEINGTVTEAIEGEGIRGETARIGTGAGVGAIIGGILGGFKGAVAGILIGGGGVIAATEGKEVELPQGTVLRVRIDSPVDLAR